MAFSFAPGLQAPLAEAHWSIRSDPTIAAVTIVNFDCDPTPVYANAELAILKCPTRTVLWTGPLRAIRNQPKTCFVQLRAASAPAAGPASFAAAKSGAFMSYDVASTSIKVGVIVDHRGARRMQRLSPSQGLTPIGSAHSPVSDRRNATRYSRDASTRPRRGAKARP